MGSLLKGVETAKRWGWPVGELLLLVLSLCHPVVSPTSLWALCHPTGQGQGGTGQLGCVQGTGRENPEHWCPDRASQDAGGQENSRT